MEVTFVKLGENEGKITVNVVESDYTDKVKAQLKEIGQKKEIPGFRKGHIDMPQLKKRFGKMVKSDVLNDIVYHAAIDWLRENNMDILGYPVPEHVDEINLEDKDYTFDYEVALAPELGIKFDKDVHLPFYNISVGDDMMEAQDKELRERNGIRTNVEDYEGRALVKGTLEELDAEGAVKEGGVKVEDAIVGPFVFKSEDEAKKFEGSKVGGSVVFNPWASCEGNEAELASMLHIDREKTAEMRSDFRMTIAEIIVNRPAEHNQAFYDAVFGADTVHNEEEYNEKLRAGIAQALQPNSANLFQRQTEEYLMDRYGKMTLPERLIKKFITRDAKEPMSEEEVDKAYADSVESIKWDIIENQAAREVKAEVTKEEVEALAKEIAAQQLRQYGMFELNDEILDMYMKNMMNDEQSRRRLVRQAFIQQLFGKIHAAVTLDEKTVTLDEFRAIVDGLNKKNAPEAEAEA